MQGSPPLELTGGRNDNSGLIAQEARDGLGCAFTISQTDVNEAGGLYGTLKITHIRESGWKEVEVSFWGGGGFRVPTVS